MVADADNGQRLTAIVIQRYFDSHYGARYGDEGSQYLSGGSGIDDAYRRYNGPVRITARSWVDWQLTKELLPQILDRHCSELCHYDN
jgi:hypothetical protein